MKIRLLIILTIALLTLIVGVSAPQPVEAQTEDCPVWYEVGIGTIVVQTEDYITLHSGFFADDGLWYSAITTGEADICRTPDHVDPDPGGTFGGLWTKMCGESPVFLGDGDLNFSYPGGSINSVVRPSTVEETFTIYWTEDERCTGGGGGGLIRPFSVGDENETYGLFDNTDFIDFIPQWTDFVALPSAYTVYGISNKSDAYVMAAGAGEITFIRPFYPSGCGPVGLLINECLIGMPQNGLIDLEGPWNLFHATSTADLWAVTIKLDGTGDELIYILQGARQYVHIGMHIDAGCILGRAIPIEVATQGLISSISAGCVPCAVVLGLIDVLGFGPDPTVQGLVWINKIDPELVGGIFYAPLVGDLTTYAEPEEACNIDPRFAGCMVNDPELRNKDQDWQTDGTVQWFDTPGIELDPGGSVYQQLNLEADTTYHMIVSFFPSPTLLAGHVGAITFSLGNQSQELPIFPGVLPANGQFEFTFVSPEPDIGGQFYTLRVSNTGDVWFVVSGICVGEEGRQIVESTCTVINPSFDYSLEGWSTVDGNVQWVNGRALVSNDHTLRQSITLQPGEYRAQVQLFVWGTTDFDGTGDISLDFTWPGGSPETHVLIPDWNLPGMLGFPAIPQVVISDITITEPVTGEVILEAVDATNEDILGVKIDRVCIHLSDDIGGYFPATCDIPSQPDNEQLSVWITWLWQNLNRFFTCDLMVLLNKILYQMTQFFKTTNWVMRYFIASSQFSADWAARSLFPWLNGHFRNMAVGQVTTIVGSGDGCHDIFCAIVGVIDTLANTLTPIIQALANAVNALVGILIGGANFFFTIAGGLITFILGLVVKLLVFLHSLLGLFSTILTAYNTATPATIEGLPTCTADPNSSLLCVMAWVMDNTVFKGRWGVLFTIIIALFSVHLVLWAIGEFKRTIIAMGTSA